MAFYGNTSKRRLYTAHPLLVLLFNTVIEGYDNTILDGHRGQKAQDEAFLADPPRSSKPWPESKHNRFPSLAVDAAPWPLNWDDKESFYHFAGYVKGVADKLGIPIRWGGDWDRDHDLHDQKFNDLIHFELDEHDPRINGIILTFPK